MKAASGWLAGFALKKHCELGEGVEGSAASAAALGGMGVPCGMGCPSPSRPSYTFPSSPHESSVSLGERVADEMEYSLELARPFH